MNYGIVKKANLTFKWGCKNENEQLRNKPGGNLVVKPRKGKGKKQHVALSYAELRKQMFTKHNKLSVEMN